LTASFVVCAIFRCSSSVGRVFEAKLFRSLSRPEPASFLKSETSVLWSSTMWLM